MSAPAPLPVRTALFASGTGTNVRAICEAARDGRLAPAEPVVLVVNRPCGAVAIAKEFGLETLTIEPAGFAGRDAWEGAILAALRERDVELIALAGYLKIVGPTLLDAFPNRILNLHPALLPAYPGLDSIERAWTAGEAESGVTVHVVDSGVDSGPVLAQRSVACSGRGLEEFEAAIHAAEHELFPATIAQYAAALRRSPATESGEIR